MRAKNWGGIVSCWVVLVSVHSRVDAAEHEFRYKAPDAQSVSLMGEFSGWKAVPMTKGSDGVWSAKVSLPAGTHAYKFLVNGSDWVFDPENSNRKKVDGIENSVVEVGGASSTPAASVAAQRSAIATPRLTTATTPATTTKVPSPSELSPTPGEILTLEIPLSAKRIAEAAKEGNAKLAHAKMGIAVPQGFDSAKLWPVLVIANTEAYSNIDAMRQFKQAANDEGWVILAADGVEAEKDKEGSIKWPCVAAAFDYLTRVWPTVKDWPVACGGMSGGAKNSSFLAADFAREHHRVIGMLMMGCNQDMASVAYRKSAPPNFLSAAVFLSSGKSDTIATPASTEQVKNSLHATGFQKLRLESFDGAHDVYQPHIAEALRWFNAQSPKSAGTPTPNSDFDKFFKKKP
jgi:AMP-activated protein kinase-like protein